MAHEISHHCSECGYPPNEHGFCPVHPSSMLVSGLIKRVNSAPRTKPRHPEGKDLTVAGWVEHSCYAKPGTYSPTHDSVRFDDAVRNFKVYGK